jgi:hypothetical protein
MVNVAQQAPFQVTDVPSSEATVTLLLAVPNPGVLAIIVTEPAATPVTGTLTAPEPAVKVTVAGTVATFGLFELRLAVTPLPGADDRFSVRFCIAPALMVRPLTGEKKLVPPPAVTWTWALPDVKPGADAVMFADPSLRPLTCGVVAGHEFPAVMKTLDGTIATEVSLLTNETVTPPAGAGAGKVTGNSAD